MSTAGFILISVLINTPAAAVEVRDVPNSPLFQTRESCETFSKTVTLPNVVCFSYTDSDITLGSEPTGDPRKDSARVNLLVSTRKWGATKP